jgi:DNA-binding PadR family transcriptional regulator
MTLVDIEDLEDEGLIAVDWGISNTGGRRGELRLTQTGERFVQGSQPPATTGDDD